MPKWYETKRNGITGTVLAWPSDLEEATLEQALQLSRSLPVVGHVALMPDAHVGSGATIGSVFYTFASIIPAAVGVDIGCGMMAVKTDILAAEFRSRPDWIETVYTVFREEIPAGVGGQHQTPVPEWEEFANTYGIPERVNADASLFPRASLQFGTLGDGNHFVELAEDEEGYVWAVLHSGSRGVGNVLASMAVTEARRICASDGYQLEDPNLAWLVQGTTGFSEYIVNMTWAMAYAYHQREAMMNRVLKAVGLVVPGFQTAKPINCHHNYAEANGMVWLTRKGAIDASLGRWGIIPGSMGAATHIVVGKGNTESYNSAPHGAGRRLTRGAARRSLDVSTFRKQMEGVVWQDRDAEALIDEAPDAYKDIAVVMNEAAYLVETKAVLKQFLNYKGTKRSGRRS